MPIHVISLPIRVGTHGGIHHSNISYAQGTLNVHVHETNYHHSTLQQSFLFLEQLLNIQRSLNDTYSIIGLISLILTSTILASKLIQQELVGKCCQTGHKPIMINLYHMSNLAKGASFTTKSITSTLGITVDYIPQLRSTVQTKQTGNNSNCVIYISVILSHTTHIAKFYLI